jgi:hypothetical protein
LDIPFFHVKPTNAAGNCVSGIERTGAKAPAPKNAAMPHRNHRQQPDEHRHLRIVMSAENSPQMIPTIKAASRRG